MGGRLSTVINPAAREFSADSALVLPLSVTLAKMNKSSPNRSAKWGPSFQRSISARNTHSPLTLYSSISSIFAKQRFTASHLPVEHQWACKSFAAKPRKTSASKHFRATVPLFPRCDDDSAVVPLAWNLPLNLRRHKIPAVRQTFRLILSVEIPRRICCCSSPWQPRVFFDGLGEDGDAYTLGNRETRFGKPLTKADMISSFLPSLELFLLSACLLLSKKDDSHRL